MTQLRVGFGKTDITPRDDRHTIYHAEGDSDADTKVKDPLCVRATAMRAGEHTAVWVTLDVLCVDTPFRNRVLSRLEADGSRCDALTLCATHTHTAPTILHFTGREPTAASELAHIEDGVTAAVTQALADAVPAAVAAGTASADIAVNRREIGRVRDINDLGAATGLVDSQVTVITFAREGKGDGLLFNYAAHPLTMTADTNVISADYPGRAARLLEDQPNVMHAQFLQGCAGNVNAKYHGGPAQSEKIAQRLRDAVLAASATTQPKATCELRSASETLKLPWNDIPTLAEARALLAAVRRGQPVTGLGSVAAGQVWAERLSATLAAGQLSPYIEVLVQATRVGDAVLVALPGEAFVEIGLALKQRAGVPHLAVAAYANTDEVGYVPTATAFPEGGYEISAAPRIYGLFHLAPDCEHLLVEAGLRVIRAVAG